MRRIGARCAIHMPVRLGNLAVQALKGVYFRAVLTANSVVGSSVFLLLETEANQGAEFTPGAAKKFTEHAEEVTIGAQVVPRRVWPGAERERLTHIRETLLGQLKAIN